MGDYTGEIILSQNEILQASVNYLGSGNIQLLDYSIRRASDTILGFLGDHVRIAGEVSHDGDKKHIYFFAKFIPTKIASHREYAVKTKAYYKEIEMYKTLFDDFTNATGPLRRHLKWRPDCYYTRDYEVVVVEDLEPLGFYMLPTRKPMDMEHIQATIISLARMNSLTFIFENKLNAGLTTTHSKNYSPSCKANTIQRLYPNLIFESECTNEPNHPGYTFWEVGIKSHLAIIDLLDNYSNAQKEKIKKLFPETVRQVYSMALPSSKFRNVITHGDLWVNNIMFNKEKDGKVNEAILVDFQMTRYAPPAQDLFTFLHVVQNRAFRREHESFLMDFYYNTLKSELEAEGININQVLPRDEFIESCKFYKKFAILTNVIYTQLNQTGDDIASKYFATPDLYHKVMFEDRSEMLIECFKTDDLMKTVATDAMEELIEAFNLA